MSPFRGPINRVISPVTKSHGPPSKVQEWYKTSSIHSSAVARAHTGRFSGKIWCAFGLIITSVIILLIVTTTLQTITTASANAATTNAAAATPAAAAAAVLLLLLIALRTSTIQYYK